jgi:hypothetical protein
MATLATVRQIVRDRLDEDTPRRWTNAQLNRWINEGARDIARRAECLQAKNTVSVSANAQTVSLSALTGLIKVNRVEWKGTGSSNVYALEYRDFNSMDAVWWDQQDNTTSTPRHYTLIGHPPSLTVQLYPIPSTSGTLRVLYWKLPAEASADSDTVEVPDGWWDVIADYAEYKALRKDSDARWREAFEIYKDNLAAIVDLTRRYTDQMDLITPETPFLSAWVWDDTWVG